MAIRFATGANFKIRYIMSTQESNKMLAEFMAGKTVETHHNKYHETWSELMAVVEKIGTLTYKGDSAIFNVVIDFNKIVITTKMDSELGYNELINNKHGGTFIEMVYLGVVEFVELYNKQFLRPELFLVTMLYVAPDGKDRAIAYSGVYYDLDTAILQVRENFDGQDTFDRTLEPTIRHYIKENKKFFNDDYSAGQWFQIEKLKESDELTNIDQNI